MYIFYLVYFCVQNPKFTLALKQAKGNCCRVRQLDKGPQESMFVSVCERHNLEESDWCIQPIRLLNHSEPLPSLFPLAVAPVHPHAGGPGESLTSGLRLTAPPPRSEGGSVGWGCHVRSFRMTVARMRKKVFQPRVTAKPRHTIIRDRPQPDGKIYIYIYYID